MGSPLQLVISQRRHSHPEGPALIRLLVERGADPNGYTSNCERGRKYGMRIDFKIDYDLPLVSPFLPDPQYVPSTFSQIVATAPPF